MRGFRSASLVTPLMSSSSSLGGHILVRRLTKVDNSKPTPKHVAEKKKHSTLPYLAEISPFNKTNKNQSLKTQIFNI